MVLGLLAGKGVTEPSNALRWEVKAHIDDNVCDPCKRNDKKLYKNRAAAYRDYPDGKGYKKCVGAQYGNKCRCRVQKRGRGGTNMARDFAALIDRARALTAGMSANSQRPTPPEGASVPILENALRVVPSNADTKRNTLYIYNAIGGWDGIKALDVALALADMNGPVDVHLNSPGGFIFEGTAIYNAFKAYGGGPVAMHIDGYAASAASFIAMAASPHDAAADEGGIRVAANGLMMIHDGYGGAVGTADDLRDVADLLDMLSDTIAATYAARAGGTPESWREQMQEGDTWYGAKAAIEAGLADLVAGADPEPAPEDDPAPEDRLSLDLFAPAAAFQGSPPAPTKTAPPIDVVGLRNTLKGAFQ